MIIEISGDKKPTIEQNVFIASSADIIGDVSIGENSSVWYQVVLRGDVMPIKIGKKTNIQDQVCIHGTYKKAAAVIGDNVTVGHRAVLHGCTIENNCLIGMGAIVMDNAHIPHDCIVGAGAVVLGGAKFEPYSLIIGSPAKVKRKLTKDEISFLVQSADNYVFYQSWYKNL